jgi:hypothetical protein
MTEPSAEASLRRDVHAGAGLTIVTGGQTGIDTYGALAALAAGLPVHLIFPAGLRQEDGGLTPLRREELVGAILHELPDPSFRYRTWTCVYVSDAVLLLDPAGGSGCQETARAARELGRPLLRPEPGSLTAGLAASWLAETGARVLLVAGCRASLLARAGRGGDLRTQLSRFMTGARKRHDLIAGPGG